MKSGKIQTSILMTFIGAKGKEIYSTFTFNSPEDKMNIQPVLSKFNAYCQSRKNLTITRYKFLTSKQAENQNFGNFVTELCHKAQESKLGQLTERLIQHVLICGIKDTKLRERLLMHPNLDLEITIQAGQTNDETKIQTKILDTTLEHKSAEKVNMRSSKYDKNNGEKYKTHLPGNNRNPAKTLDNINVCNYCDRTHKRKKLSCIL